MITTQRLTTTNDQNIFFGSDFHLNHNKDFVFKARGFDSRLDHRNFILKDLNERVRRNDILFYLGDFCLNTDRDDFLNVIDSINCQNIYMLFGNHNSQIMQVYLNTVKEAFGEGDIVEVYPIRHKNLVFFGNYLHAKINGQQIIMSHYQMSSWNHMSHGSWMLHGHEHSVQDWERDRERGKVLDIGVDNCIKNLGASCISFGELKKEMYKRNYVSKGHH